MEGLTIYLECDEGVAGVMESLKQTLCDLQASEHTSTFDGVTRQYLSLPGSTFAALQPLEPVLEPLPPATYEDAIDGDGFNVTLGFINDVTTDEQAAQVMHLAHILGRYCRLVVVDDNQGAVLYKSGGALSG